MLYTIRLWSFLFASPFLLNSSFVDSKHFWMSCALVQILLNRKMINVINYPFSWKKSKSGREPAHFDRFLVSSAFNWDNNFKFEFEDENYLKELLYLIDDIVLFSSFVDKSERMYYGSNFSRECSILIQSCTSPRRSNREAHSGNTLSRHSRFSDKCIKFASFGWFQCNRNRSQLIRMILFRAMI